MFLIFFKKYTFFYQIAIMRIIVYGLKKDPQYLVSITLRFL